MSIKQKWIIAGIAYLLFVIATYFLISPNQVNHDDHAEKALMSLYS